MALDGSGDKGKKTGRDGAAVIIPTLGRSDVVARTTEAVLEQLGEDDVCIVIAQGEQSCREATVAVLQVMSVENEREKLSKVPLLIIEQQTPNRSKARNSGFVEASVPYVVILDDDAVPRPGWLEAILKPLVEDRADLVAGRLYEKPDITTNAPEISGAYITWTGHTRRNYNTDRSGISHLAPSGNMALRRELAMESGGFDSRFSEPSMYEDVEFSERLRRMGARVWYCADAVVDHLAVQTGGWREEDQIGMEAGRAFSMSLIFRLHRPLGWPVMALSYLGAAKWKVLSGYLPFRAIWKVAVALVRGWKRGSGMLPPLQERTDTS